MTHYNSRGYHLPYFMGDENAFPECHQTPYFDALELLDFFVQLDKNKGGDQ